MKRSSYGGDEAFARHGDDNMDLKGSENAVSQPVVVGRPYSGTRPAGAASSSGGTNVAGDSAHEDDPSPHGRVFRTGISPAENQVRAPTLPCNNTGEEAVKQTAFAIRRHILLPVTSLKCRSGLVSTFFSFF